MRAITQKPLRLILAVAFCARLAALLVYADLESDFYYEYGEIAKNLLEGKGYSYFVHNELGVQPRSPDLIPAPTAYMPPGYVAYLLPFLLIENVPLRNGLLLFSHILISTLTVWLLHRLTARVFDDRTALWTAAVAAVIPEFLYANLSFTPTVLYHLLVVLLFLRLWPSDQGRPKAWDIGLLVGLLIYLRSEFALFALLLIVASMWKREVRKAAVIASVAVVSLLPWTVRNYVVLDAVVPMATGFGLNLYRGHNPYGIGVWGDDELAAELRALDRRSFEVEMNRIYQEQAIAFIRDHPFQDAANSLRKLLRFWSFDPQYERSTNPLYYVPNILVFLLGLVGMVVGYRRGTYRHYYLFFFYSVLVVLLFFPLPRYQTMMKILLLPFAVSGGLWAYELIRQRGLLARS